jgi:hypothetical protein
MRIEDCKLAITPGGKFVLWTPDEAIKIVGWAKDDFAEIARQAFVDAQKRMVV